MVKLEPHNQPKTDDITFIVYACLYGMFESFGRLLGFLELFTEVPS